MYKGDRFETRFCCHSFVKSFQKILNRLNSHESTSSESVNEEDQNPEKNVKEEKGSRDDELKDTVKMNGDVKHEVEDSDSEGEGIVRGAKNKTSQKRRLSKRSRNPSLKRVSRNTDENDKVNAEENLNKEDKPPPSEENGEDDKSDGTIGKEGNTKDSCLSLTSYESIAQDQSGAETDDTLVKKKHLPQQLALFLENLGLFYDKRTHRLFSMMPFVTCICHCF